MGSVCFKYHHDMIHPVKKIREKFAEMERFIRIFDIFRLINLKSKKLA